MAWTYGMGLLRSAVEYANGRVDPGSRGIGSLISTACRSDKQHSPQYGVLPVALDILLILIHANREHVALRVRVNTPYKTGDHQ